MSRKPAIQRPTAEHVATEIDATRAARLAHAVADSADARREGLKNRVRDRLIARIARLSSELAAARLHLERIDSVP